MNLDEVALGVHDLIPVTLAAIGLALVVRSVRAEEPVAYRAGVIGAVLVVMGGLSKAVAKLIGAMLGDAPPQLLDEALFPLLAPGMVLLAAAVVAARTPSGWAHAIARRPVIVPFVVWPTAAVLAAVAGSGAAKGLLIGVATIGNVVLGVALIRWSMSRALRLAAILFAVNLVVVIGLAGMARALEQTTATQWIEQNVNLLGQLAFLVAARSLLTSVTARRVTTTADTSGRGDGRGGLNRKDST